MELNTGINWTNLELTGLLEDEDSSVYLESVQKHIGLHPFHLTNLNKALQEILNKNLNFYDPELNGLLLAYRRPKILSPLGDILYDTCFVHIDIEADFYIFRPKVGRSLKGFVNKKGTNHIGILVHKTFNVSIPKPDDIETIGDWPGDKVNVGQEVRFTPDEIDYSTSLPYIRGSVNNEEYLNGCQLFNEQIAATYESDFYKSTISNSMIDPKDVKNILLQNQNKRIVFHDSDSDVDLRSDSEAISRKESITVSPKKSEILEKGILKKQIKHLIENDNLQSKVKDGKKRNSLLKTLTEDLLPDSLNNVKKEKRNKKYNDNNNKHNGSEDEANNKSMALNQSIDDSLQFQDDVLLIKKSKKRKKKLKCEYTENTEQHISEFDTILTENPKTNSENKIKLEPDSLKCHSRKRKRSSTENIILDIMENGKIKNLKVKNHSEILEVKECEAEIFYGSPSKKRIKKYEKNKASDTEDERATKKSLHEKLLNNVELDSSNDIKVTKKHLRKKETSVENDDSLMDTEDERAYKVSLKTLIKSVQNDHKQSSSEFKEPKIKKHKKKHKMAKLSLESETDPLLIKIKNEPESGSEDIVKDKTKKRHSYINV